jgi:hypothetical protein
MGLPLSEFSAFTAHHNSEGIGAETPPCYDVDTIRCCPHSWAKGKAKGMPPSHGLKYRIKLFSCQPVINSQLELRSTTRRNDMFAEYQREKRAIFAHFSKH